MSELIVIRADATPTMGTGHVMRCLALAQAWEKLGNRAVIIGHIAVPWVRERLKREGVSAHYLNGEVPAEQDPVTLLAEISDYDAHWVVLDGYHFSLECQKAVKNAGYRLLVIDDYNHLPEYCCDILLNQNINAPTFQYSGEIGTSLLGSDYVLLRQDIITAKRFSKNRAPSRQMEKILLTLGGGDESHAFDQLKQALHSDEMKGRTLRVIAGSTTADKWNELLADCPATVELVQQPHEMTRHMQWADFCITAGGSTCWELCALGIPFVVFDVAENQKEIAQYFESALRGLEQFHEIVRGDIEAKPIGIHSDGSALVAGCMVLFPYTILPVKNEHAREIYAIAADRDTRKQFFSPATFSWENHFGWFTDRIKKDDPFYVLADRQSVIGYVRFDKDGTSYIVSIALAEEARGAGIGYKAVMSAIECIFMRIPDAVLRGYILRTNPAAIRAAQKAGFYPENNSGDDDILTYYSHRMARDVG